MIPHLSFRKKVVLNLKIFLVGDPPSGVSPGFTLFAEMNMFIILLMLFLKARVQNRHIIDVVRLFVGLCLFALQSKQFRPGLDGARCGDW